MLKVRQTAILSYLQQRSIRFLRQNAEYLQSMPGRNSFSITNQRFVLLTNIVLQAVKTST